MTGALLATTIARQGQGPDVRRISWQTRRRYRQISAAPNPAGRIRSRTALAIPRPVEHIWVSEIVALTSPLAETCKASPAHGETTGTRQPSKCQQRTVYGDFRSQGADFYTHYTHLEEGSDRAGEMYQQPFIFFLR